MRTYHFALFSLFAIACSTSSPPSKVGIEEVPEEETMEQTAQEMTHEQPSEAPTLRVCNEAPLPGDEEVTRWAPEEAGTWQNRGTRVVARMSPRHVASDRLSTGQSDLTVEAKFSYGPSLKDMEEEIVQIWYDDCSGSYRRLAMVVTDDNGWATYQWPVDKLPEYGEYNLYFHVLGDGSAAQSTVRLLPAGTKLAIFDIDGTLTTGDREALKDLAVDAKRFFSDGEDYRPENRDGAPEVTRHRAEVQGYVPAYVTGRPYWMKHRTQDWKESDGFAPGHIRTTRRWRQWRPATEGVGEFKANYLRSLQEQGFEIAMVYGDTRTDAHAYGQLGLEEAQIFFVGHHGELDGVFGLGEDYLEHLSELRQSATDRVRQPFVDPS